MRVIRNQIAIDDYQELHLPQPAQLLSVATARTSPDTTLDLWSLDLEKNWPKHTVAIYIVGTGHTMPDQLETEDERFNRGAPALPGYWRRFIGTVVTPSGLVWHVFQGPVQ